MQLVLQSYWWPGLERDVRQYVSKLDGCSATRHLRWVLQLRIAVRMPVQSMSSLDTDMVALRTTARRQRSPEEVEMRSACVHTSVGDCLL
ncbi:TPA: hypothetical protein ACH3X2_003757 [Trebouxia sp. C0005]